MIQTRLKSQITGHDRKLSSTLVSGIEAAGDAATVAASAEEKLSLVYREQPDLLLSALTPPNRNGPKVLQLIRQQRVDVRMLILTSRGSGPPLLLTRDLHRLRTATKFLATRKHLCRRQRIELPPQVLGWRCRAALSTGVAYSHVNETHVGATVT